MGLFGFVGNVVSASVKVVATPIAATVDVVKIATGNEADTTKKLLKSVGNDLEDAGDQITGDYL